MFQVRFHGRGGQGAVTAAEMLSVAAFIEGKHAQALPSFGPERSGAPVTAFCRIDLRAIRTHEPIAEPDAVVVQDATLLHVIDAFQGLKAQGFALVNTSRPLDALALGERVDLLPAGHARGVSASEIALTHLGRPLPNAALLGALAALTSVVGIDAIVEAVERRFDGAAREGNANAARAAFAAIVRGPSC